MSDQPREGLYVYQPFGSVTHPEHEKAGRLWGVGGLPLFAKCEGLTREEASAIVTALSSLSEDAVCEHGTALDVHCCNCHSGFIFDRNHECPAAPAETLTDRLADELDLDEIAGGLFADLCEGDGEHSEQLDRALIRKHLRRAIQSAHATQQAALRNSQNLVNRLNDLVNRSQIYGPADQLRDTTKALARLLGASTVNAGAVETDKQASPSSEVEPDDPERSC